MPFGLDLKSVIAGIVLALFVWPFIMQMLGAIRAKNRPAQSAPRSV